MKVVKTIVGTLLLLTLTVSAKQDIIWVTGDPTGESKNKFWVDLNGQLFNLLEKELKDFNFSVITSDISGQINLIQKKENVCVGNKFLSDARKEFTYHTHKPQLVVPDLQIYAKASSDIAKKMKRKQQGFFELTSVIQQFQNAKIAVEEGRSYGSKIDSIMVNPEFTSHFWYRTSEDTSVGMFKMLEKGRTELLIEYPNIVAMYKTQGVYSSELIGFPLSQKNTYVPGHILCSKSEIGRHAIEQFDKALINLTQQKIYFNKHFNWLEPSSYSYMTDIYNEVYGTNFTVNDIE